VLRTPALIALLLLAAGPARAQPAIARARALVERGDLRGAAALLEPALAVEPTSQPLYRELSELYDQRGLDYGRALELHRRYLAGFPDGPFARLFKERQTYLERHRAAWPLLLSFRRILEGGHRRSPAGNISAVEKLLTASAGSSLEPELLLWLATEQRAGAPARALSCLDRALALPAARSASERHRAQLLRVQILGEQRRYGEALAALRELPASDEARHLARELRAELWARRGFYLAAILLVALCGLAAGLRPWRQPGFAWRGGRLAGWVAALLAVTLLPMLYLRFVRRLDLHLSFVLLAAAGVVGLLCIKLLSPLAARVGRPVYLGLSLLVVCSGLYVAYYLGGTLAVLEWPFEAWRRMR
jgi:tetratricopeptide (TPR) repeat protein